MDTTLYSAATNRDFNPEPGGPPATLRLFFDLDPSRRFQPVGSCPVLILEAFDLQPGFGAQDTDKPPNAVGLPSAQSLLKFGERNASRPL